jgi:hypothetical protein
MTNQELTAATASHMRLIDGQLDTLGDITGRMKATSIAMNGELRGQLSILDTVDKHMDKIQSEIDKAIEKEQELKLTRKGWVGWVLAIILTIAIVLVWII